MENLGCFILFCIIILIAILGLIFWGYQDEKQRCKDQFGSDYYYVYGKNEASFCYNAKTNEKKYVKH